MAKKTKQELMTLFDDCQAKFDAMVEAKQNEEAARARRYDAELAYEKSKKAWNSALVDSAESHPWLLGGSGRVTT